MVLAVVALVSTLIAGVDVAAADPSKSDVISAYAPIVHLHPDEDFMPMDASRFVAHSELWWEHDSQCGRELVVKSGQVDSVKLGGGGYRIRPKTGPARYGCERTSTEFNSQELTRPWEAKSFLPYRSGGFSLKLSKNMHSGDVSSAPVYYEYSEKKSITFWFFYGFNNAPGFGFYDHQGDWEKISVELDKTNRARRVVLFQHEDKCVLDYADVKGFRGHPEVYSAIGTHATYPSASKDWALPKLPKLPMMPKDRTAAHGYSWKTYERMLDVTKQPWYNFGGAWGKIGSRTHTTGPLGPRDVWPSKLGVPSSFENLKRCTFRR